MTLRALYDVPAPAKLNRFLHVVGRRADGYHLLQSVFVLIDWTDTLHFERRDEGRIARHDLAVALPEDDLCLRAARALRAASGTPLGADISIDKRVPWGAGLGGGSSDAATTLLALNRLWRLNWPRRRLAEIGLAIGADVPFFVGGRNAFVEGIGDVLTPMTLDPAEYVVVKPPVELPTRDVFAHPRVVRDSAAVILAGSFEGVGGVRWPAEWGAENGSGASAFDRNDLQAAAEELAPDVAQAAGWLRARYGNGRMTGSGSAVFARVGPTATSTTATSAQDLGLPPRWVGRRCRGLAEHPLRGWAD